jgi:hypothetical protein
MIGEEAAASTGGRRSRGDGVDGSNFAGYWRGLAPLAPVALAKEEAAAAGWCLWREQGRMGFVKLKKKLNNGPK